MAVDITFETHSTTLDNEHGIATGWFDGQLSPAGRDQARQLGHRRRDRGYAIVFCSDLTRAVETAQIAFAESGLPVIPDARLRECNYGLLNGHPVAEIANMRRECIQQPFPDGESYTQVVRRVHQFLQDLMNTHPGERVVVIGHSATRWALDFLLRGIPLELSVDAPFNWQEGWDYSCVELHLDATRDTGVLDSRRGTAH